MGTKDKPKLPPTPAGKVKKWLLVRAAIKKLEPLLKTLKPFVDDIVKNSPGRVYSCGTSTLKMIEVPSYEFNLARAEKALGKERLAPFWVTKPQFNVAEAEKALGKEVLEPFYDPKPGHFRLDVD